MKLSYFFLIVLAFLPRRLIISLMFLIRKLSIMNGDPEESNIKNTFVSNCRNETFSVNNLVFMLRQGFVKFSMMPKNVKIRVEAELMERHPELKTRLKIPKWKINSFSDNVLEESK